MAEKILLKTSDATELQAYVARPEGKPRAGLILLQEAYGINSHIRKVCDRFAAEGYLVVAPELFHRTAPAGYEIPYGTDFAAIMPHYQGVSEAGLAADVKACFDWLKSSGQISQVGSIGYCLGGRCSYLANATLPLDAAVSYYGGRIVPNHLPQAKDQHGPLLLYWGGLDKNIPPDHVKSLADALRAAGKTFTNVEFSYAEHAFNCDDRPNFNPEASEQAWALTLAFFKKHLS
jgi:carboxymethylenebutenolidase